MVEEAKRTLAYLCPACRLPVESMYGPAGMDGLLDCFHFDCLPREELLARHRFRPAPGAEEPWRKRLITPEQSIEKVFSTDC